AFALRSVREMAETTILAGSVLLLVLVNEPGAIAIAGTAVSLLGCVALLAASHEQSWASGTARAEFIATRTQSPRASANSWPTLYIVGLLTAAIAGQGFSSTDITGRLARELQLRFARMIAVRMMLPASNYVTAEPRVYLYAPGPTGTRPQFEVRAKTTTNWRLAAYPVYTGRFWSEPLTRYTARVPAEREGEWWRLPILDGAGKNPRGERLEFTITARLPMAGGVPAALWPRYLELPGRQVSPSGRVRRPRIDIFGNVWLSGYIRPGDSYTVVALRSEAGREPASLDPQLRDLCLQLPPGFPDRVRQLARSITAGKTRAESKVSAITTYLSQTCVYDDDPPWPPEGQDPVDFFLFDSHRGHCVHFASATVLLCRCIGLPARFVSGYLEGDAQSTPDVYLVRAKDAHAWAEVFIPRTGWVEVDPTPPRPPTPGELAAHTWDRITGYIRLGLVATARWALVHIPQALVLIAACGIALYALTWYQHRQLLTVHLRNASPRRQVEWAYELMARWFAEAGAKRLPNMTPTEHIAGLGDEWEPVKPAALSVTQLFCKALYSHHPIRPADGAAAVKAAEAVRDHWLNLMRTPGRDAPR
ncbi:MAG: transglutaminase domain-containing protein, partial [Armatimonadetes bacterium]|nr:transglutaminase domain-containing protein [Armatimonadota bacterium]